MKSPSIDLPNLIGYHVQNTGQSNLNFWEANYLGHGYILTLKIRKLKSVGGR